MTPEQWISRLQLAPHPEGGHYREFYRSPLQVEAHFARRSAVTIIHFLLQAGQHSRWHVVTADEIWRHTAGGPLELLEYSPKSRHLLIHRLGPLDDRESQLTHVIPAGHWQAARPLGDYTLVECTVAPGFDFTDFCMICDIPAYQNLFDGDWDLFRKYL